MRKPARIAVDSCGKRLWRMDEGYLLRLMGHCKGKDNVKKHAKRRKKTERLALAKSKATAGSK
jgi:hypothetical protein